MFSAYTLLTEAKEWYNIICKIYERKDQIMLPKDAAMLLSAVNLKLRDYYKSLEELCDDMDEDMSRITQTLAQIDYHYDRERNQFV